ncbi:hypothetical protein HanPSC8_Chr17g0786461 [Helianthus annuus]|nr:hypothetical protein HanPSC8_Chr17g0786461 [Helianthus annuus]
MGCSEQERRCALEGNDGAIEGSDSAPEVLGNEMDPTERLGVQLGFVRVRNW